MKHDPFARNHLLRDALGRALYEAMSADERVYLMGEGCHIKQTFDAPQIANEFPARCLTLPIAEDAGINMAVGMAIAGLVPVFNVISSDFLFRCMDSIANTCCKLARIREAKTIVIQAEYLGDGSGPTSGQVVDPIFRMVPGLLVRVPQNPDEAYAEMRAALNRKAVTLLIEDRNIPDGSFS